MTPDETDRQFIAALEREIGRYRQRALEMVPGSQEWDDSVKATVALRMAIYEREKEMS